VNKDVTQPKRQVIHDAVGALFSGWDRTARV
jgi:hypothetical protein